MYETLAKENHLLRIAEYSNSESLVNVLYRMYFRYNRPNSYIILTAYAWPNGIVAGKNIEITRENLQSLQGIGKSSGRAQPRILLDACSTGIRWGFAEELSKLGLDVTGPEESMVITKYQPIFEDGELIYIEPTYYNLHTQKPVRAKRYINGEEVESRPE